MASILDVIALSAVLAVAWLFCRMVADGELPWFRRKEPPPAPPQCPDCGYGLYFAEGLRCPECGRPFDIGDVDLRLAEWDGKVLRPKQDQDARRPA